MVNFIKTDTLKQKPTDESKLGFGRIFTDYMFTMRYSPEEGWHDAVVEPYHAFEMDPAAMVLHYGQTIFEGLKCYRREDGGLQLFRPRDNFARMNISAERLSIPQFDADLALEGLLKLLDVERDWVPHQKDTSLYIRPFIIATDPYVGVRASNSYIFCIILSPVGAYYAHGLSPVGIYVEDNYVRAVRGGFGFAKTAGNYAASLKAGEEAKKKGFDQVLWLDGVDRKYVEEVGSMNMMFVVDGVLKTPALNGSILAGITRDSILKLAEKDGIKTSEERIAIADIFAAADEGKLDEAFGTGTAAVVSPVGELCWEGRKITVSSGEIGPITAKMYNQLTDIQWGRAEDPFGWIMKL
ncbi:MAG: branched-chain amino acid aminotransferase [Clostridia bacterium]|nr:branched-chain amino acid aminotransferase [Clostridia bacterium]